MKVVCYFADKDGSHPHCTTADYDKIWPVMQESVERQGYELIHLTSLIDRPRSGHVIRYDIDPATVMYSREVAWVRFLESLRDGEEACLVEPDAILLRRIPPLKHGMDMLLLWRPLRNLPSGFRLAKKTALPFYRAVVAAYEPMAHDLKVIHGDVHAHHALLGIEEGGMKSLPKNWKDPVSEAVVRIEHRHWIHYTSKLWRGAVAWNFKGTSKQAMVAIAEGRPPILR